MGWRVFALKVYDPPLRFWGVANKKPPHVVEGSIEVRTGRAVYVQHFLESWAADCMYVKATEEVELTRHVPLNRVGLGVDRLLEESAVARYSHIHDHIAFGSDPVKVLTVASAWCSAFRNIH